MRVDVKLDRRTNRLHAIGDGPSTGRQRRRIGKKRQNPSQNAAGTANERAVLQNAKLQTTGVVIGKSIGIHFRER